MKTKSGSFIRFFVILGIVFSLAGGITKEVKAASCTWTGSVDRSWGNGANWSCGNVPTSSDDVYINNATNDPLINSRYTVNANSITLNSGSILTVSEQLTINASQVTNNGTIYTTGMDSTWIQINSPFNNQGMVNAEAGIISCNQGGDHTGTFTGTYGQISFNGGGTYDFTFSSTSQITVKKVAFIFVPTPIDFLGTINQTVSGKTFTVDNSQVTAYSDRITAIGTIYTLGTGIFSSMLRLDFPVGSSSVAASTEFIGEGTINGDLTNAGTVRPGSSPGTINVDGNYTQESTGTLSIELGGTTPDTEYDQLVITGAASLDGTLDVSRINDFSPSSGQSFSILTYGSHTGTFSSLSLPDLDPGLAWEVAYGSTAVTLTVREGGGSISGTVNYSGDEGYNPVTVGLFTDPGSSPVHTIEITSTTGAYPYEITGIPNGTYYVAALMDLNGNHQPDPDEPYEWYGSPTAIVISDETLDHTGIDIQLGDTSFPIYLPLILR